MDVEQDVASSRWVGRIDGQVVAALDYRDDGATVTMTRAFTDPSFRGRGLAAEITGHAVDRAERDGRRVRPTCWYVAQWFDLHPDRQHLLA